MANENPALNRLYARYSDLQQVALKRRVPVVSNNNISSRMATALMQRNPDRSFFDELLKSQEKYSRNGVSQVILRRAAGSETHSLSQSIVCW